MRRMFVGAPLATDMSSCGYCAPPPTPPTPTLPPEKRKRLQDSIWAVACEPADYQALIDRGWRRSGCFLYRPHVTPAACCALYTIRLPTHSVAARRSHRRKLAAFAKRICALPTPPSPPPLPSAAPPSSSPPPPPPHAWPLPPPRAAAFAPDVAARLAAAGLALEFVKAEDDVVDPETFALYAKYQVAVHGDAPDELSESSFARFLVNSPMHATRAGDEDAFAAAAAAWPPPHLAFVAAPPSSYGSFHLRWRLHGALVAVSFLDVLPACLSSVYFVYDPDHAHLSLGIVSALVEILLTHALSVHLPALSNYYLGYYIATCPKMAYKAQYAPFELLCPATLTWVAGDQAVAAMTDASTLTAPPHAPIRLAAPPVDPVDPLPLRDPASAAALVPRVFRAFHVGRDVVRAYDNLGPALAAAAVARSADGTLTPADAAAIDAYLTTTLPSLLGTVLCRAGFDVASVFLVYIILADVFPDDNAAPAACEDASASPSQSE